jgi:hypothetical protein
MRKKYAMLQKKILYKEEAEGGVSGADAMSCMELTNMTQCDARTTPPGALRAGVVPTIT